MVKSDDTIVSQSEFDAGVTYLEGLKADGAKPLIGCGYNVSYDDKIADGMVSFAGKHGTLSKNAWYHVVKFADA